jgi:hypothetical protein
MLRFYFEKPFGAFCVPITRNQLKEMKRNEERTSHEVRYGNKSCSIIHVGFDSEDKFVGLAIHYNDENLNNSIEIAFLHRTESFAIEF